jgi:uncharacterized caspase-like protein
VALVIGNASYRNVRPLQNPVNDAQAMTKALRLAGFETILVEDAGKEQMEQALQTFRNRLLPGDVALFYYSGHGFQMEHQNYLVPIDYKSSDYAGAKKHVFAGGRSITQDIGSST